MNMLRDHGLVTGFGYGPLTSSQQPVTSNILN